MRKCISSFLILLVSMQVNILINTQEEFSPIEQTQKEMGAEEAAEQEDETSVPDTDEKDTDLVEPAEQEAETQEPSATDEQGADQELDALATNEEEQEVQASDVPEMPEETEKASPGQESATKKAAEEQAATQEPGKEEESTGEKPKKITPPPEVPEPAVELSGPEQVKIDTIDLTEPKGNWLIKRWWWEQAEVLYEKIKQREEEVFEDRMGFLKKRIDMDRTVFNPFYKNVGIGQGELSETITMLITQLEGERKKGGVLNEQERAFLEVLQTEKKTLEKLQENVDSISEADLAIDDALLKLMEQINRVRGYERQAWDKFKAIARELSDQRAYELYEEMKGLSRNVTDILLYIRQPFDKYFQDLNTKAADQVEKIKADIQMLKEKGIDLKQESQRLDIQESQKEEQERERACAAQVKKAVAQTQSQKRGWFGMIGGFFSSIGRGIMMPFNYIASWFAKPSRALTVKQKEAARTVQPAAKVATQAGMDAKQPKEAAEKIEKKGSSQDKFPDFPEPPAEQEALAQEIQ